MGQNEARNGAAVRSFGTGIGPSADASEGDRYANFALSGRRAIGIDLSIANMPT